MLRASDKVSDLIFSPGRPPQVELAGKLVPVRVPGLDKLTPAHTAGIAKLIIGNQQSAVDSLEKSGSADLSFSAPGEARFRVIAYPPVPLDAAGEDEQAKAIAVTARLNALMEQWIREQPDEWMCANRRWEKSLHRSLPK